MLNVPFDDPRDCGTWENLLTLVPIRLRADTPGPSATHCELAVPHVYTLCH
jgi:hypothetical protein